MRFIHCPGRLGGVQIGIRADRRHRLTGFGTGVDIVLGDPRLRDIRQPVYKAIEISRLVYSIVGICAIYQVLQWKSIQRRWGCAGFPSTSEA